MQKNYIQETNLHVVIVYETAIGSVSGQALPPRESDSPNIYGKKNESLPDS